MLSPAKASLVSRTPVPFTVSGIGADGWVGERAHRATDRQCSVARQLQDFTGHCSCRMLERGRRGGAAEREFCSCLIGTLRGVLLLGGFCWWESPERKHLF